MTKAFTFSMHEQLDTPQRKKTLQDRIAAQVELQNASQSHRLMDLTTSVRTFFDNYPRFTAAIQSLFAKPERDTQILITGEHLLGVLLLGVIFFVRVTHLAFNTLHLDEAIYATVGEDTLSGVFQQGASGWMFGSYLYPITAALMDQIAGEIGLRFLSAALSTVAAIFVYLIALRLFDRQSALWTLFVFGLAGISINLGQHAVYDALGVPLLALTLYCLICAIQEPRQQQNYLEWAGVSFSLTVLAKYIGILTLPALLLIAFWFHLYYGRRLLAFFSQIPWQAFIIPDLLILGIYGAFYFDELREVLTGQFASQPEDRAVIVLAIVQQIGVPIFLAVIGAFFAVRKGVMNPGKRHPKLFLLLLALTPLLLASLLAMPLYHLITANIRSLWKHNVYTLVFLAPLSGYGLTRLIQYLRSLAGDRSVLLRGLGAVLTAITLFWFVIDSFRQNTEFHHSWPNNQRVMGYMRSQNLTPQTSVLSSSYAIYEYYFDFGVDDRQTWSNVWYTEYGNLSGTEAIQQAIQECAFDIAILDTYYAPDFSYTLAIQLQQAGYAIVLSEVDTLANGSEVMTNVYVLPEGECRSPGV